MAFISHELMLGQPLNEEAKFYDLADASNSTAL